MYRNLELRGDVKATNFSGSYVDDFRHSQFLQQSLRTLSSETIFLVQVSDFLGQISDVATQFVVSKTSEGKQLH